MMQWCILTSQKRCMPVLHATAATIPQLSTTHLAVELAHELVDDRGLGRAWTSHQQAGTLDGVHQHQQPLIPATAGQLQQDYILAATWERESLQNNVAKVCARVRRVWWGWVGVPA
jgi:hypothetical protein